MELTRISAMVASRKLFKIGLLGGAALGYLGYPLLVVLLETFLVPPFRPWPNYGQFGVVVLGVTLYIMSFGMALATVPYVKWYGYVLIYIFGLFLVSLTKHELFGDEGWTSTPVAAMLFLLAVPIFVAGYCDLWSRKRMVALLENDRTNNTMDQSPQ